jgi:Peptidase A4 family
MSVNEVSSALPKGARMFELPPDGFDPMTASAGELRRYGLPRRPDPDSEPQLARLYARAFSRPRRFVKPELVVDSRLDAINAKREGKADFSSGDWGGAVVTTPASDPPNMVFAQFQVPTVLNFDPELTQQLVTGFWVGIGGYGNNSLLQAGIAATVTPGTGLFPFFGSVSYWAWTEWWPNGFIIDNLAISPGDAVSVLVCAPQPDHGFVSMENLTTGQIVSVGVDPPAGLTANGPSAEWIIESLSVDTAAFTPWTCINCQAGSHDSSLTLAGATTLNMADNEVQTTVTSPSSVTVTWEKYS